MPNKKVLQHWVDEQSAVHIFFKKRQLLVIGPKVQ